MNCVILQGNVTHDPDFKYVDVNGNKVAVCKFSLATHRHFRTANKEKKKETTFIDCEVWDSGAETIYKYVKKGGALLIRGSLKNDNWEKDGQKFSKIRVRVDEFELPPKPKTVEAVNEAEPTTENQVETPTEENNGKDIPF